MTLTRDQQSAVRSARSAVMDAVHLGVEPGWLADRLRDEADHAAEAYAADQGARPTAVPEEAS